jgi:hypothetical protein
MRPFPFSASLCALAVLLAADAPSQAAWNNVFQVSCFHKHRTEARYLAPACCPQPVVASASPCCPQPCCPQPVCTTQYVQRSYYQPVTCYQQKTWCEPVTTYQTSYYYEQVCSYRYSCYYDPCTCSYQQVATPVTSYRLRSRCCPVTSYLQRCQMVPVTSYKLSYYYEPVTTCCTPPAPTCCPPAPSCCSTTGAVTPTPAVGEQAIPTPAPAQPHVGEDPGIPATPRPRVGEDPGNGASDSFYQKYRQTQPPPMSGAEGSSYRQPKLQAPEPAAPAQHDSTPPKVRLEKIVMLPEHNVEGKIVRAEDSSPRAGARLLFVSADKDGAQESLTTDAEGKFQTRLARGGWLVYVRNREGTPVFQKRIEINDDEPRQVLLTSR